MTAPMTIGELNVTFDGETAIVHGPNPLGIEEFWLESEPVVLFERVRFDDCGNYRPLSGARTLPTAWAVRCEGPLTLPDAIDIVYPSAALHMAQWETGSLRIVGLETSLERQTGRYLVAAELSPAGRALAADVVCGRCVRQPVWREGFAAPAITGNEGAQMIPCPEACSVLVSFMREAALWQTVRPEMAVIDDGVAFAAFDVPGNELREEYLREGRRRL